LVAIGKKDRVELSWTAVAYATSYTVHRGTETGVYTDTFTSPSADYSDRDVVRGTMYYYVVSASNAAGESDNSAEQKARPLAVPVKVTGLAATAGDGQVSLSWTAPLGAETYHIKRRKGSGPWKTANL